MLSVNNKKLSCRIAEQKKCLPLQSTLVISVDMQSFSDIIDRLGGPSEAGRKLGTTQQNASQMKHRDNIPARFWPAVIENLPELSLAALAEMAVRRGEKVA